MRNLYSAGIAMYSLAVKMAANKNEKARLLIDGHKEVFNYLKTRISGADPIIWIHASSLGEFEQGRPLIERIKSQFPQYKILLTFFSPSGYEVRKDYKYADYICYLPFDKIALVRQFLDIAKPEMAFFIKYEFWANYLFELKARNIPVYLISAIFRPSQIFFKSYGAFFRNLLTFYKQIFVQNESSYQLLQNLGLDNISISGDTRFDRVTEIAQESKTLPVIEEFVKNSSFTLVAGSSWPKDEDIIFEYFNNHPQMKLIIAPHEIDSDHIESIISRIKRPYVRYMSVTERDKITKSKEKDLSEYDVIIIDCIGLLSSVYKYGNCSYIGGGFGVGIHNILEAAVYNIPVIFGPNYRKFNEAVKIIEAKGGFAIKKASQFDFIMDKMISNKKFLKLSGDNAGNYVKKNSGASEIVLDYIFEKEEIKS